MDRCAIFVDAGYLYAAGGELCCGVRSRAKFDLNASAFIKELVDEVQADSKLPILRTYWYDGAKRRIPTVSQQEVAATPNVKLRLGSMNGKNQQKGVDALIYRDLMTLARERSIAHAYLLSGDEDLREGVQAAQELGVLVTLVGITPVGQQYNQSRDLVNEADALIQLEKTALTAHFTLRTTPAPVAAPKSPPPATVKGAPTTTGRPPDAERSALANGRQFGETWRNQASDDQRTALVGGRPRIPATLDAELLRSVETDLGLVVRNHDDIRKAARRGFWQGVSSSPVAPA